MSTKKPDSDEFHVQAETPIGRIGVRRKNGVETPGLLTKLPFPMPGAEYVQADPRKDNPAVLDLKPPPARQHKGPPKVATDRYRRQWERTFGGRKAASQKYVN